MVTSDRSGRREQVLDAALDTFVRYGFRKTSMDDVARAAAISRPGLYFLFSSKEELFRQAAARRLDADLDAVRTTLASAKPLAERLVEAFDLWTGRYVGPLAHDLPAVLAQHPEQFTDLITRYPATFADLIRTALADRSRGVADTLVSTAIGIKHRSAGREEFLDRLTVAVDLLTARTPGPGPE